MYYYVLNLASIFESSGYYYCTCDRFQGCRHQNGEENYCSICKFKIDYYPKEIKKYINPKDIANLYKKIKESLKECVMFDWTIHNFWLYHFKIYLPGVEGGKIHIYLKDTDYY